MTPTERLVSTFRQMLRTLAGWMGKAGGDDAILPTRLASGMFPLATQGVSPACSRRRRRTA